MKWYSVKKYKPSINHDSYLVRTESDAEKQDCDINIGHWDYYNTWINAETGEKFCRPVTHFCVPDPVEIDE